MVRYGLDAVNWSHNSCRILPQPRRYRDPEDFVPEKGLFITRQYQVIQDSNKQTKYFKG